MKKLIPIIIAVLIVIGALIALGSMVVSGIKEKYAPSNTVMELTSYYTVADDEAMIIFDDDVYGKRAYWRDGKAYLDLTTVTELFNHRFFWSEDEKLLLYTTPTEVVKLTPGESTYIVNGAGKSNSYPFCLYENNIVYIALEYVAQYSDMQYQVYEKPNRVMIQYQWGDYLYSDVQKATQIRTEQSIKADILKELAVGERLMYIDGGGIQENGFIKVMSMDGVRGYVSSEDISDSYYGTTVSSFTPPEYSSISLPEPVYLGWQLLYTTDSVASLEKVAASAACLTVVAPTWYYLTDTEGSMQSYANVDYVAKAHELGLQVWATYKNDTIEGAFSCTEDTHKLLSSTESREKLIAAITESVAQTGVDGVNIDFEMLKTDSGVYFIEFLRELSVACRRDGVILSVDNYVPEAYNAFYDIAEQGKIVDYVIIMGYDEHYAGSDEEGSVSSLPWFTDAIAKTLSKTDPEKVIMALPFYTRLWKIEVVDGKRRITVEANPNMDDAEATLKAYGVEPQWKDKAGQYYGEYKKGNATYKLWLEEEKSIYYKTAAIRDNRLAGVAAWKLGDEKTGIWDVISSTMSGDDSLGAAPVSEGK